MTTHLIYRLTMGLLVLILISAILAVAATNTVPVSGADESTWSTTANDLKPSECAGLNLTEVRSNGGGSGRSAPESTAGPQR